MKLSKEESAKLREFLWRALTDFTHWINEEDFSEAINCLDVILNTLERYDSKTSKWDFRI